MKNVLIDRYQQRLYVSGLIALLLSAVAAVFAGLYLGEYSKLISYLPGLLVLVPPSINMRGSISGVLASRLSSSMHLGLFEASLSKKSVMGMNLHASLAISILIAFALGVIVSILTAIFNITGLTFIDYVLISVISGLVASLIVMGFTVLVILAAYKNSIDLDMVGSPAVTTIADLITIPILIMTALFIVNIPEELRIYITIPIAIIIALSLWVALGIDDEIRSVCKDMVSLLVPLSILCTLAGIIYASDISVFTTFAVFLILITPFTGGCGSIGGIFCSRLATQMHMGEIPPKLIPSKEALSHFAATYIYAIILMPFLAILAYFFAKALDISTPDFWVVLAVLLIAGLIVTSLVNIVGYITASLSFIKGFDPDNFGIPVITSFIDLIGATTLVIAIGLFV